MGICEEMRTQLHELADLLKREEQHTTAVANGAVEADQGIALSH